MTLDPTKAPPRVALSGLLGIALDALLAEFHSELQRSEFGDIRQTHGCVFRFVRDDGKRLTEIAELAGMTKQSVGEVVDDLVARGYVQRIPDPADKRAKLICLTERGQEAQTVALGIFAEIEADWIERYGRERYQLMREVLEDIARTEAPQALPELNREELTHLNE